MQKRSCIIIEDQPPAQRILKKYIEDIGSLELKATFPDAIEAIDYLQGKEVDLIFLDIHLPKISGIDFLKTLPNSPQIILTTAFSEYAIESYEYNVIDYLLKPFSFQRFVKAITKSIAMLPEKEPESQDIYIKSGYDLIKVNRSDIIYLKSDSDYIEIVTPQKTYLSSDTLKHWLEKLGSSFFQVHKSYIINTEHLHKISGNNIYTAHDINIPIGRAYKEKFISYYLNKKDV